MKFISCAILLTFLTTKALAFNPASLAEIETAESLWNSKNLISYSYLVKEGGVFGFSEYKIKVNGEKCSAKSRYSIGSKFSSWKSDVCTGHLISEQFARSKKQMLAGTNHSTFTANAGVGYIQYFSADPITDATDQDWYIEIKNFKVVGAK